jgi:hypothetical protein
MGDDGSVPVSVCVGEFTGRPPELEIRDMWVIWHA